MDTNHYTTSNFTEFLVCWTFYITGIVLGDLDSFIFHLLQYLSFAVSITVGIITINRFVKEYKEKKNTKNKGKRV